MRSLANEPEHKNDALDKCVGFDRRRRLERFLLFWRTSIRLASIADVCRRHLRSFPAGKGVFRPEIEVYDGQSNDET
jgi:hypothetical protein